MVPCRDIQGSSSGFETLVAMEVESKNNNTMGEGGILCTVVRTFSTSVCILHGV